MLGFNECALHVDDLLLSTFGDITFSLLFQKQAYFGELYRSRTGIKDEVTELRGTRSLFAFFLGIAVIDESSVLDVSNPHS